MNAARIEALANLIDAMVREQKSDGFPLFCILSEDKISMSDAEVIAAAMKAYAKPTTE